MWCFCHVQSRDKIPSGNFRTPTVLHNIINLRVIQPKKFSSQAPKIRLPFRYSFMEAKWFLPILQNHRATGLRRCKKQVSANPSIFTLKLKRGMFFYQKNKWNWGVKSNFENSEFWVVPISKSALVATTVHQIWKIRLVLCMVFNEEFDFCSQHLITSLLRNSIFLHSEALLSSIMQN